jgi:hypothetical protein
LNGVTVFPCGMRGRDKVPLCSWRPLVAASGRKRRPLTREEADAAWARFPNAMPGLAVETVGAVVVDLDAGHGGLDSFKALERAHGFSVDGAPAVRTPGGGKHIYFADPDGRWRNTASKLALGVDVRGVGGYVMAAGACRPGCKPYTPIDMALDGFQRLIAERQLEPPPRALAALLDLTRRRGGAGRETDVSVPGPASAIVAPPIVVSQRFTGHDAARLNDALSAGLDEYWTLEGALAVVRTAAPGTRNNTFAREAFIAGLRAQALGLNPDETVERLIAAAAQAGSDDPKTDDTIRRCFSEGVTKADEAWAPPPAPQPAPADAIAPSLNASELKLAQLNALRVAKRRLNDAFLVASALGRGRIYGDLVREARAIPDASVRRKLMFTLAALLIRSGHSPDGIIDAAVACGGERAEALKALAWARSHVIKGEVA